MDKAIKTLLESGALDDNLKAQLKEAWEKKETSIRAEIKESVELEVREELTSRYQNDVEKMVEAMDKFITESVEKELTEFAQEREELRRSRVSAVKEMRSEHNKKLGELDQKIKALEAFTVKSVAKELNEFSQDKRELAEARKQLVAEFDDKRKELVTENDKTLAKLENFVISRVSKELGEFEEDRRALREQRVKLAAEGRRKIDETRKKFVTQATGTMEKLLRESIEKEFVQFREDIEEARQNNFGRKLFEAYAAEYMTSYLNEGSIVQQMQQKLDEANSQLNSAKKLVEAKSAQVDTYKKKVQLSEETSRRSRIINDLIAPLGKAKREVMEDLLRNVATDKLTESFSKYLPSVLNSGREEKKQTNLLKESQSSNKVALSGNRRRAPITESKTSETDDAEAAQLKKLAGIK